MGKGDLASTSGDDNASDPHTSDELASADPFRRAEATLRLGRNANLRALDQLLALLDDPDWPVVEAALKSLRRYRDPRIVTAAQATLRHEEYFKTFTRGFAIGWAAARALRSQGEEGFQALLTLLPEVRDDEILGQVVIKQLAVIRDPRAIGPLIACFGSPVYEVAHRAAMVIHHFGADAIPSLIAAMSAENQSVYFHVAWALRWMGAPAVPALLDVLRHSPDKNIRAGAADVLDWADSEDVREALRAALEDPDEDVRHMAVWSLGRLGDLRALDMLLAERANPRIGDEPADTLARMGSEAVPQLIAALADSARPAYQRVNAARALCLIGDNRTVEPLIVALYDDDEDVRAAAASALRDLKDARVLEPLLAALRDSSSKVRLQAAYALTSSEDGRAFNAIVHFIRESWEGDPSRFTVLHSLALHHGERALPLLREMAIGSDGRAHPTVLASLSRLGAHGVTVLLEIARDPRIERRYAAITWLKYAYHDTPDPRIAEFLFEVTQEQEYAAPGATFMRIHATEALAGSGDPRAVGPLLEALQNPANPPTIRTSAVESLGELGDERVLAALMAVYQASMAGEDGIDGDEQPRWRYEFQDALLRALAKIHARLGTT